MFRFNWFILAMNYQWYQVVFFREQGNRQKLLQIQLKIQWLIPSMTADLDKFQERIFQPEEPVQSLMVWKVIYSQEMKLCEMKWLVLSYRVEVMTMWLVNLKAAQMKNSFSRNRRLSKHKTKIHPSEKSPLESLLTYETCLNINLCIAKYNPVLNLILYNTSSNGR